MAVFPIRLVNSFLLSRGSACLILSQVNSYSNSVIFLLPWKIEISQLLFPGRPHISMCRSVIIFMVVHRVVFPAFGSLMLVSLSRFFTSTVAHLQLSSSCFVLQMFEHSDFGWEVKTNSFAQCRVWFKNALGIHFCFSFSGQQSASLAPNLFCHPFSSPAANNLHTPIHMLPTSHSFAHPNTSNCPPLIGNPSTSPHLSIWLPSTHFVL
jgi:hypothetical protein